MCVCTCVCICVCVRLRALACLRACVRACVRGAHARAPCLCVIYALICLESMPAYSFSLFSFYFYPSTSPRAHFALRCLYRRVCVGGGDESISGRPPGVNVRPGLERRERSYKHASCQQATLATDVGPERRERSYKHASCEQRLVIELHSSIASNGQQSFHSRARSGGKVSQARASSPPPPCGGRGGSRRLGVRVACPPFHAPAPAPAPLPIQLASSPPVSASQCLEPPPLLPFSMSPADRGCRAE